MRRFKLLLLFFVLVFMYSGLYSADYFSRIVPGRWLKGIKVAYSYKDKKGEVPLQIYFPRDYKKESKARTLILLHGYTDSIREWEVNSHIEYFANKCNIVLVCPGMRRSIYASKFFPESVNRWHEIPGSIFVGEVLVEFLKDNFSLATNRKKTGICGYSMGARGALLVASQYNDTFGVAACLAGPYDHLSITRSKALSNIYGKYQEHKKRWKETDNLMKLAKNLQNTPVFLYHGKKDFAVKWQHTTMLMIKLNKLHKENGGYETKVLTKKYHIPVWKDRKAVLGEMMAFIDKKMDE